MKVVLKGKYDEFIGIHNACKDSAFIDDNEFDYFNSNKADVVIFRLADFNRTLFKNLQRYKIPGICISDKVSHKRLEQAKAAGIEIKAIPHINIIGFDYVRYPIGVMQEKWGNDEVWFPDEFSSEVYFKIKNPRLKIYCQSPIYVTEYAGWPDDNLLPDIISSASKVHYYYDKPSYNSMRVMGCCEHMMSDNYIPSYSVIAKQLGIL